MALPSSKKRQSHQVHQLQGLMMSRFHDCTKASSRVRLLCRSRDVILPAASVSGCTGIWPRPRPGTSAHSACQCCGAKVIISVNFIHAIFLNQAPVPAPQYWILHDQVPPACKHYIQLHCVQAPAHASIQSTYSPCTFKPISPQHLQNPDPDLEPRARIVNAVITRSCTYR